MEAFPEFFVVDVVGFRVSDIFLFGLLLRESKTFSRLSVPDIEFPKQNLIFGTCRFIKTE